MHHVFTPSARLHLSGTLSRTHASQVAAASTRATLCRRENGQPLSHRHRLTSTGAKNADHGRSVLLELPGIHSKLHIHEFRLSVGRLTMNSTRTHESYVFRRIRQS